MDEPRTPRPTDVRIEGESLEQGIGLLCSRDDDIRSSQWAETVFGVFAARCCFEGPGG